MVEWDPSRVFGALSHAITVGAQLPISALDVKPCSTRVARLPEFSNDVTKIVTVTAARLASSLVGLEIEGKARKSTFLKTSLLALFQSV